MSRFFSLLTIALALSACSREYPQLDVHVQAKGCYALSDGGGWLTSSGGGYAFDAKTSDAGDHFFLQPADLATYLLYDQDGGYLVAEERSLTRETSLHSDVTLVDDDYISGAQWVLETSTNKKERYQLRSLRHGLLLGEQAVVDDDDDGAALLLEPVHGCLEHPELSLDAQGTVTRTTFEDGDLYGIVDTHSHILNNFSYGGSIFHGGAFHPLGVEHALPDCASYHGEAGRKDFFGYAFDASGNNSADLSSVILDLVAGELSEDNHLTAGYPSFPDWPNGPQRSTHQTQYYRWLERAHLAGLRLVVQHASSNAIICKLAVGQGLSPSRYDCEDMTAVDRIIDETYAMQDYIDAQSGGPGQGWFRIVTTPTQAREVIEAGDMAVVIGIETSDLFSCYITPHDDGPECDEAYVIEQLDAYYARGVRALFPVHKYDNAFSPGDGSGDFIELGNFFNSGHWTNMTEECPTDLSQTGFDDGEVTFGGLFEPREDYDAPAPNDVSDFEDDPLLSMMSFYAEIQEPAIEGDWCQNASLTPLGETLILEMMKRGMILEVDHFPQWAYTRAFELLEEHAYPAAGTHGRHWDGKLYALGGISKSSLGRCQDPDNPGSTLQGYLDKIALIESMGGYPAEGFGFDLNGFAGARGPRFGENGCSTEQPNPMAYPFTSYAGDVEFTQPHLGERLVDFDTEGMVHIGMLPELLQDARADAVSDEDLEPLFRSAEGYVRMWELAESRAAAMR